MAFDPLQNAKDRHEGELQAERDNLGKSFLEDCHGRSIVPQRQIQSAPGQDVGEVSAESLCRSGETVAPIGADMGVVHC